MITAKILFVFYLPSGGMETLNRQRCKALKNHGIDCHLLYLQNGTGMQNISEITTYITNNDEEIKRIIMDDFDAIFVCSDINLLHRIRKLGFTGKLIYEVQGLGSYQNAEKILLQAKPNVETYSNGILFPNTPHLINLIHAYYPSTPKYCFHNCFDKDEFCYVSMEKPSFPIVGWVGRIEENKNWKDYLEFSFRFLKHRPDTQFWMFIDDTLGDQKERMKFNRLVTQMGLSTSLKLHANIPHKQMANYFSMIGDSGGFLLSTSKVEGFGYAVIEAMSCRCPVLSSDSDGVKAFIAHNQTGKFYTNARIETAVPEALELVNNVVLRSSIIDQAYNHLDVFNLDTYAQEFINILK
ncbi:glycosyltransferase family 4 protein [Fictibacillus sp. 7GRE50]|uniref:glycosyltransferase family 4 protein n=1 Tax=Fictibacillus sp. 7GRE50 TaxID=2745878 RepID=UPI0018CE1568|nr:glycosyltransferase family 4 protein [Fictibacillus sp. 7GRE50]MBH0166092.1 glycosyltransferase family 4 protein [Fictibacillus sp. 7GRE50]